MTEKHKRFCEEYVANGYNGTQAYLKVYKCKGEKSARDNASRLIARDSIKEHIQELSQKATNDAILTAIERKKYLSDIVNGKVTETVIKGKDADMFNVEAGFNDKIKAIDTLNKMDGQYIERHEIKKVETDWFIDDGEET